VGGQLNESNVKLPLAICGLGRFATRRVIPAIAQCTNIELVAVVDRSGKEQDLPIGLRRFMSLESFLETNPIGAVYITSPNYLHARQSLQCLAAGLHVLCEKPMATKSVDCQSMLKAARDLNLHLSVGHMLRYSPAVQLARQWMQNGVVGEPNSIRIIFHYDLPEISRPWVYLRDCAGGGALMDAGIHCIDVIRFLTGDPVNVLSANTDRHSYEDGIERSANCNFISGGVSSSIEVCSQAPYATLLKISGTKGEVVIDNFAACWGVVTAKLYTHRRGDPVREEVVDVSSIYAEQLRNFANMVGQPGVISYQDTIASDNVRIIEELYAISKCL